MLVVLQVNIVVFGNEMEALGVAAGGGGTFAVTGSNLPQATVLRGNGDGTFQAVTTPRTSGGDASLGGTELITLLFLVGFEKRLVWTISAFTLAHSITLALSSLGWLTLRQILIQIGIPPSNLYEAGESNADLTYSAKPGR